MYLYLIFDIDLLINEIIRNLVEFNYGFCFLGKVVFFCDLMVRIIRGIRKV